MKSYLELTMKEKKEIYEMYKSCRYYVYGILKKFDITNYTYHKVLKEASTWR